jgi:hypothetical protein
MAGTTGRYPNGFLHFLEFLCQKYGVDRTTIFVEYSPNSPPRLRGNIPGYYDGLLSHREKNGRSEFLITVFEIARDPLLTLGHEFAHLVEDLTKNSSRSLGPPDEAREKRFDRIAMRDLDEFRSNRSN